MGVNDIALMETVALQVGYRLWTDASFACPALVWSRYSQAIQCYFVFQRPSFCPVSNLTPEVIAAMPSDTLDRGIHGGAAVLLESCDGRLLLTRRAAHLRTFPNVWVPPG